MDNMENNTQGAPAPEQQTPAPSMPKPEQQFQTPVENKALQPKKAKSKLLVPLLAILVLAIIGAGAWYYVYGSDDKASDDTKTTDTSTTTTSTSDTTGTTSSTTTTPATATTDETADWKTYTNTATGFSLKYPSTWVSAEKSSTDSVNWVKTFQSADYKASNTAVVSSGERITIDIESPSSLTWQGIMDSGFGLECQETVRNDQNTRIAGATARIIETHGSNSECPDRNIDDSLGIIDIYTSSNSWIRINYDGKDATTLPTLDKIINTITFTSTVSTADWKTWTRDMLGNLTFKTPNNWNVYATDSATRSAVSVYDEDCTAAKNISGGTACNDDLRLTLYFSRQGGTTESGEARTKTPFATWVTTGGGESTTPSITSAKDVQLSSKAAKYQVENNGTIAYYVDLTNSSNSSAGYYLKLHYKSADTQSRNIEAIINSINFSPTNQQISAATQIP